MATTVAVLQMLGIFCVWRQVEKKEVSQAIQESGWRFRALASLTAADGFADFCFCEALAEIQILRLGMPCGFQIAVNQTSKLLVRSREGPVVEETVCNLVGSDGWNFVGSLLSVSELFKVFQASLLECFMSIFLTIDSQCSRLRRLM